MNKKDILKIINDISLLKENYDGYNSISVLPQVIKNSLKIINNIPYQKIDDIYPNPNGTISIEFENNNNNNNKLFLEIGKTSFSYFSIINNISYINHKLTYSKKNYIRLSNQIKKI